MGAVLRLCCDRVVRGKGTKRGGALYAYYFGLDPVRGKRRGGSGVWGEKGAAAGGVADRATGNPPPLFFVGGQTRDDKGCQAVDLAGAVTARARAGAVSEGLENNKKQVGGAGNGRERHGRERGGGAARGGNARTGSAALGAKIKHTKTTGGNKAECRACLRHKRTVGGGGGKGACGGGGRRRTLKTPSLFFCFSRVRRRRAATAAAAAAAAAAWRLAGAKGTRPPRAPGPRRRAGRSR